MEMRGPLKGWNSWNTFGANINDALIRESAEAVAKSGLKDAVTIISSSTTAGRSRTGTRTADWSPIRLSSPTA